MQRRNSFPAKPHCECTCARTSKLFYLFIFLLDIPQVCVHKRKLLLLIFWLILFARVSTVGQSHHFPALKSYFQINIVCCPSKSHLMLVICSRRRFTYKLRVATTKVFACEQALTYIIIVYFVHSVSLDDIATLL